MIRGKSSFRVDLAELQQQLHRQSSVCHLDSEADALLTQLWEDADARDVPATPSQLSLGEGSGGHCAGTSSGIASGSGGASRGVASGSGSGASVGASTGSVASCGGAEPAATKITFKHSRNRQDSETFGAKPTVNVDVRAFIKHKDVAPRQPSRLEKLTSGRLFTGSSDKSASDKSDDSLASSSGASRRVTRAQPAFTLRSQRVHLCGRAAQGPAASRRRRS
jgi:hypothetical protein